MRRHRRGGGFHPAGELSVDQLGLPRNRARELMLSRAWQRVAGEAVARRVEVHEGRRGVLHLRVRDERWASALRDMLPRLAARLASECPELSVQRFKIECAGTDAPEGHPLPPPADEREATRLPAPESAPDVVSVDERPVDERLEDVIRQYLSRQRP